MPAKAPERAIVGEKVGMTQIWDESQRSVAVTVVRVTPVRVVQVKTPGTDGYAALQVTYGARRPSTVNKPLSRPLRQGQGRPGPGVGRAERGRHLFVRRGPGAGRRHLLPPATRSTSPRPARASGFAGAIERHNFNGQGASHGNHKHHRAPGSVGACATPARVFKGTRMAGRLGNDRVTTLNLEVVSADAERNLLLLKGAVPGPRGGLVLIRDAVKGTN